MMYKRWIKSTLQEEKLTKFIYTLSAEQKEEQKMFKVTVHSHQPDPTQRVRDSTELK